MTRGVVELFGVGVERFEHSGDVLVSKTGFLELRHVAEGHGLGTVFVDPLETFGGVGFLVVAVGVEAVGLQTP